MREAKDATLKAPTLILPSLQVNIRAGALPPPVAVDHRWTSNSPVLSPAQSAAVADERASMTPRSG
jgi:hypothetical protein